MIRSSWSSLWIYLPHREAADGGSAVAAVVAGLAEPELESRLEVRGDALAALEKLENEVGHWRYGPPRLRWRWTDGELE